ncbi:hypothetical protein TNCV_3011361 [Trichonephila clavipes]|nr:hypothetical protein TNCV_3011361 [Trichonephila clavipes]
METIDICHVVTIVILRARQPTAWLPRFPNMNLSLPLLAVEIRQGHVPPGVPIIKDINGEVLSGIVGPYNEGEGLHLICETEGGL